LLVLPGRLGGRRGDLECERLLAALLGPGVEPEEGGMLPSSGRSSGKLGFSVSTVAAAATSCKNDKVPLRAATPATAAVAPAH